MPKFKTSKLWYIVGALLALNIAVHTALAQTRTADHGTLHFFDVGQGDAIYFRTPAGNDVVIDGGPHDKVLDKLGRALPWNDRKIELVVLTHPHADHVSGIVEILKRYEVEKVLVSDVDYSSSTYRTFLELLEAEGAEVIRPRLGQRIYLDDFAVLDILYPVIGKFTAQPKDPNTVSTVARLTLGQSNILFTGDADKSIESLLLSLQLPLESEILKVGHQGSRTSSGEGFLDKVGAEYGVISVGQNSYGHPHEEVLGALMENNLRVLRTDEEGDIVFEVYPDKVLKK